MQVIFLLGSGNLILFFLHLLVSCLVSSLTMSLSIIWLEYCIELCIFSIHLCLVFILIESASDQTQTLGFIVRHGGELLLPVNDWCTLYILGISLKVFLRITLCILTWFGTGIVFWPIQITLSLLVCQGCPIYVDW